MEGAGLTSLTATLAPCPPGTRRRVLLAQQLQGSKLGTQTVPLKLASSAEPRTARFSLKDHREVSSPGDCVGTSRGPSPRNHMETTGPGHRCVQPESFSIINATKMETRNKLSKSSKASILFKTIRPTVTTEKQHHVVKSWIFTGAPAAGSEPAWEAQGSPAVGPRRRRLPVELKPSPPCPVAFLLC